jgi:SAM-dependent methyltransferase
MIKLHLGSGYIHRAGYINIDKYITDKDIKEAIDFGRAGPVLEESSEFLQADIRKLPFKDNYADYIECIDVIEHFGFFEVYDMLKEVKRVMKPGAIAKFMTLNFDALAQEWLDQVTNPRPISVENFFSLMQAIYGNQSNEGNFHKSAWTPASCYQIFIADMEFASIEVTILPRGCSDPPDMEVASWQENSVYIHESMLIKVMK